MGFFFTILVLVVPLGLTWRYLGSYMAAVFDGRVHFLGFLERPVYRMLGTSPEQEQTWKRYAGALVIFSAVSIVFTYVIMRIQGSLPLNPQHIGRRRSGAELQHGGLVRHQHQLAELRRRDDDVVLLPDRRSDRPAVRLTGRRHRRRHRDGAWLRASQVARPSATSGSTSLAACSTSSCRSPSSSASSSSDEGAVETLAGTATFHDVLNGVTQTIARGPIGFMEAIKQLGTNGGGFLDQNSATTVREPDRAHQLPLDLPAARHSLRPHLHLRQDGRQHQARRGAAGGDGDPLRRLGRLHRQRRAPEQPGRRGGGHPLDRRQHRRQGGPLRRHVDRTLRCRVDADLDRLGRRLLRLIHADRRSRTAHRHDARRGHPGRYGQRPLHHARSTPSSRCSSVG